MRTHTAYQADSAAAELPELYRQNIEGGKAEICTKVKERNGIVTWTIITLSKEEALLPKTELEWLETYGHTQQTQVFAPKTP